MPASIYSVPESVSGTWERIFRGIGVMDIKEVVKTAILRNSNEWGDEQAEAVLKAINEAGFLVVPAKAQAVPEWIDVSDRLPEEGEEVFVHHYGHIVQATRDKKYSGGFKQRNCYGWQSVSSYISHWMPKSIELPERYHFYYENDAKQKAMIEAQEPAND
ncbi:DUF551 domain-containing protein [Acinetobacter indicus]|uniref:DUF551 domain-containing protein n=1 Tax=Acinetobacter indicus TaxID=756892 RepID=UPI003988ED49